MNYLGTGHPAALRSLDEISNVAQPRVVSGTKDNPLREEERSQDSESEIHEVSPPDLSSLEGLIPPLAVSRYHQTLSLLLPLFPLVRNPVKGTLIINTADVLLRDNASDFLLHQLPLWEGPWQASPLPDTSVVTSLADRLVAIDQSIDKLERYAAADGLALHFHSVVQYQLCRQLEREISAAHMTKSKGVGDSSITLNYFLPKLYPNDWETIEQKEKKRRKTKFNRRKADGKRLQILCDNLGYGILLLGSRSAMRTM
jgi:hypothetical protein